MADGINQKGSVGARNMAVAVLLGIVLVVVAGAGFVMGDSYKNRGTQFALNTQSNK